MELDMIESVSVTMPSDFADLTGVDPLALVREEEIISFRLTARPHKWDRPSPVVRPVRDHFEPSLKLNSILVSYERQNRGTGTRLLEAAVRYADLKQLPIWLCAVGDERMADNGANVFMTTDRLVHWYGRYGFVIPTDLERNCYGIDCRGRHVGMIRYHR
ncbi:GNAT family N-acetyltransferase [Mycobacteroides abscessus]|uniref:GNAT family N-acetyltransferase n=1 Tax=Mycobacteroides abscessus TaxID=36809 RepID=UPI000C25CF1A|nr:GNAT family N-acetyltransferase [Mycobacteroides abscessus]